ncbi:Hypothetical protein, putative [Bodo saltans]|uniref:Membrane-associated protein n=1 Tax=Bodo saltans TaxID=75058 RepID=A0A0S4JNM9_BODSA|nr:Hypothetical protein, putative [Bodo saltans]|eukprot:CUG91742.1 Hypothetical protein, putative [Bodo saltans]
MWSLFWTLLLIAGQSGKHLRVEQFAEIRSLYNRSHLWQSIVQHVPKDQLSSGIFARFTEPAHGRAPDAARYNCQRIGTIRCTSVSWKKPWRTGILNMRSRAINIASNAIIQIKLFNGLCDVDPMTATTWFGAAFALACSNETQSDRENAMSDTEHKCITKLRTTYGLMSDLLNEGCVPEGRTASIMTSAAVELGFAGFGISPSHSGWIDFEHKIADTITMHGFGTGCAGAFKIPFPPSVRSARAPDADPLVLIKDYLRKHAYTAKKVTQMRLKETVTTYDKAMEALEKHAKDVCGKTAKEPCVVVALSGDKASFADIVVGVLTPEGDSFRTTHLLLVQAKHCSTSTLSVLKEWVEMRRMGSDEREAAIAGCVAQLTRDSWDDAMKPLIISADTHHETFKEARKAFNKEMKRGHKLLFKFPSAETMDKLFKGLCGDDTWQCAL